MLLAPVQSRPCTPCAGTSIRYKRTVPNREEEEECPRFAIHDEACRVVDVANLRHEDGISKSPLNAVTDYFSHSCLKMYKICLKRTLDATFLCGLSLTFCDVTGELLLQWACPTLQVETTFLLASKLADIPVSRVRKHSPDRHQFWGYSCLKS